MMCKDKQYNYFGQRIDLSHKEQEIQERLGEFVFSHKEQEIQERLGAELK